MLSDEPYDKIQDDFGVPDFLRIMVANRLSSSGREWVDWMRWSATGTYSSQWMVVDAKRFRKSKGNVKHVEKASTFDGLLLVLDQAPTVNHAEDMSALLQQNGYYLSLEKTQCS
eukprot:g11810.t1